MANIISTQVPHHTKLTPTQYRGRRDDMYRGLQNDLFVGHNAKWFYCFSLWDKASNELVVSLLRVYTKQLCMRISANADFVTTLT